MTKRKFKRLKSFLSSLRLKFVAIFLIAVASGIGIYFLSHRLAYRYINEVYISEEKKTERENAYVEDLQDFIDKNGITSEDTSSLSEWVKKNKYVYVIIYRDSEFFFTSDDLLNPPKEPEAEDKDPENEGNEQNPSEEPDENPDENPEDSVPGGNDPDKIPTDEDDPEGILPDDDDPEGIVPGEDDSDVKDPEDTTDSGTGTGEGEEKGESDKGTENPSDKNPSNKEPGGVTIDYPTREELFAYAWENDMYPLELADDEPIFVSLTDFTEYFYYDISNIAGIGIALLFALIVLVVYFHRVTSRIIRLGKEVNKVADGNVDHAVIAKGNDEISKLSLNVDNMRESMIKNFKKEREALDANNALITSMSHDIRTPLTVLLGYIDVMQSKADNDDDMQSYLKAAESTALRLKNLSDDMFSYFLVFGGKELEIKMERYDAAQLMDQMLFEHITLMRESGYKVTFDGIDYDSLSGAEVRTDAQKLIRIFDNIFSNIYKYADKSCEVTISAEKYENKLAVSFSNFIAKNAGDAESNGIGLKTCKKLAEYINSEFEFFSNGERFSATLSIELMEKEL